MVFFKSQPLIFSTLPYKVTLTLEELNSSCYYSTQTQLIKLQITSFIDFNMTIIANHLKQPEERNLVAVKTRPRLISAYVLNENGSGGKSGEKQPLPEALASLQPLVSHLPHSSTLQRTKRETS